MRGAPFVLHHGDALEAYAGWPAPTTIVSDGGYGVGGFPGDPRTPERLADWYRPHVAAWSRHARPATTLWFWNTELGWATVHPLLVAHGWQYQFCAVWDKGVGHVAGNVNGATIRRLPVVTEVCVFYSRALRLATDQGTLPVREWLRHEWRRAGLPLARANEACGVRNAATRKYLTGDWLWYLPPPAMVERLAGYANQHGRPSTRPYYSLDGVRPVDAAQWAALRYTWHHQHAVTNVWRVPPLRSAERVKGGGRRAAPRVYNPSPGSATHLNQKPLALCERIVLASTDPGDVVWEPFGGLCSLSVAAVRLGRRACSAELDAAFHAAARRRLRSTAADPSLQPA